jgi:hypothetical protein
MLLIFLLAMAGQRPTSVIAFSNSYRIAVSADGRACTYWLTDAGLDIRQLRDALKDGYDVDRGAEILPNLNTPARCVRGATQAVRRAGFTSVRVRLGTEKDRMHGIP